MTRRVWPTATAALPGPRAQPEDGTVSLVARHGFDVGGVDDPDGELALQEIEDGFPIATSRLHRDVCGAVGTQPVAEGEQLVRRRSERADLCRAPAVRIHLEETRHDGGVVHIQSAAPRICTCIRCTPCRLLATMHGGRRCNDARFGYVVAAAAAATGNGTAQGLGQTAVGAQCTKKNATVGATRARSNATYADEIFHLERSRRAAGTTAVKLSRRRVGP